MTPEQFVYWLQGYVELIGNRPSEMRWKAIKEHLETVFVKVTPGVGAKDPGDLCATCGNPRVPHRYRHVFKEPVSNESIEDAVKRAVESTKTCADEKPSPREQRENRRKLAEMIGPITICSHDRRLC